jgi:chromosome partitioning protein
MPIILVANPKGGAGKSTLATNIAGYFARQGKAVMLGDVDVQQSSLGWLSLRPAHLPPIATWDMPASGKGPAKLPKGTTHAVIDTPAGVHEDVLTRLLREADKVVIPIQPSPFDIGATSKFLASLKELAPAALRTGKAALVGIRVDERTRSADHLKAFVEASGIPAVTMLRDTQNYVHLAAHGLTLWDVAPSRVEKDMLQWEPLISWLNAS